MTEPDNPRHYKLVDVVRPDGRLYRPRKMPAAVIVHDHHEDPAWIYVLRTHELDRARRLAEEIADREQLDLEGEPWREWVREGMNRGERFYFNDAARGVPAVIFRVDI